MTTPSIDEQTDAVLDAWNARSTAYYGDFEDLRPEAYQAAVAVVEKLREGAYERLRETFASRGQQFGADTLNLAIDAILGPKE